MEEPLRSRTSITEGSRGREKPQLLSVAAPSLIDTSPAAFLHAGLTNQLDAGFSTLPTPSQTLPVIAGDARRLAQPPWPKERGVIPFAGAENQPLPVAGQGREAAAPTLSASAFSGPPRSWAPLGRKRDPGRFAGTTGWRMSSWARLTTLSRDRSATPAIR